ncbi:amidase [Pararobbsia alpina]|uniref:2-amino-5-chloromuconic acid deaminase n=1 Tax=Pararobbsia alpina TaxID=621374 RepID=A0A6S7D733_9BURK|nr:amidase [Pararobbsia alpina]CAB3797865.1 2-amino-5-chloromuconic acid deaminase [Pararobbsia alpina]
MNVAHPNDPSGVFVPDGMFNVRGASVGPLERLRVGVKDVFDIAGRITGAGNPDWRATHAPAARHARVVDMLLANGADVVGKTLTDELAYSLNGENHHYGTPVNPVSPVRIPGGSSAGSAVAVGSGQCDIGLGTDTAGSIRLPATFCGVWGFRPTHGAVSSDGVVPLAPSYDVVGWMTPTVELLARVGEVLLPPAKDEVGLLPRRLLLPEDAWSMADSMVGDALSDGVARLGGHFARTAHGPLSANALELWQQVFRVTQGREAWKTHGAWIRTNAPAFGPGIRERFQWASTIDAETAAKASAHRAEITETLDEILTGALICIPTVAYVAPMKGTAASEENRTRALCLLSIASLAGLPQITVPIVHANGYAVGLSLIGPRNADRSLLALAENIPDWV